MALLTLLSIALLAQPSEEPLQTAICNPVGNVENGVIENFNLRCPPVETDPDGYIDYLNALLAAFPETVELPRSSHSSIEDSISLTHTDHGWRLTEPTPLIRVAPDYPLRAAQNGVSGRCAVRLNISETGHAEVTATACEMFRGRAPRSSNMFERKTLDAVEAFVWLPMPGQAQTCHTTVMDFLIDGHTIPDAPVLNAPTCPDAP